MPKRTALAVVFLLAASGALTACAQPGGATRAGGPGGSGQSPTPPATKVTGANLVPTGYDGRFRVIATVLESPDHGPQLCHFVRESLPPQCEGPDVVGWDWDTVEHDSANGTTWGDYLLTGTWNGSAKSFTLTEPAVNGADAPASERPREPELDFTSPCPTPEGGWQPVDPAKATPEAMEQALNAARAQPDFAGAWVDQSYLIPGSQETDANDPKRLVLNVRFTKDLRRHEAELRTVWGGALCVSLAVRTLVELATVRAEVTAELGQLSSSLDEVTGVVEVTVMVATEAQQAHLDRRYGPGAVALRGLLRPID